MYASVRVYTGSQGLADTLVQHESEFRPIISGIGGFKAYYLVRTADGAASVSVFDDQAGAEESNRTAAEWIRANLPDLSVSAPQISGGEVVVSF